MADAKRGEVWLVDLGMAAKVRPALVLSVPFDEKERALYALVPHTTNPRSARFEATIELSFLRPGAFNAQGLVTIPAVQLVRRLGKLNSEQLTRVEQVVLAWLGLLPTSH